MTRRWPRMCSSPTPPRPRHGRGEGTEDKEGNWDFRTGVSAVTTPESPPRPESLPHPNRSLRPSPGGPRSPACDNSQNRNRRLAGYFHLTGVSTRTGHSGAYRPDTPAQVMGQRAYSGLGPCNRPAIVPLIPKLPLARTSLYKGPSLQLETLDLIF